MGTASRCPKCAGRLFVDHEVDGLVPGGPELACLVCGWRRVVTPAEAGLVTAPERLRHRRVTGDGRP